MSEITTTMEAVPCRQSETIGVEASPWPEIRAVIRPPGPGRKKSAPATGEVTPLSTGEPGWLARAAARRRGNRRGFCSGPCTLGASYRGLCGRCPRKNK